MRPAPSAPEPQRRAQRVALAVIMGLTFLVVAWMAAPLLVGLALGTVAGFTAQPLHARLSMRMKQRRALASAVTTLLGGLLMLAGGAASLWVVARQLVDAASAVQHQVASGSGSLIGPRSTRLFAALGLSRDVVVAWIQGQIGRLGSVAAQAAGVVVEASAGALLTIVVALWTMYYVLLDWPRIERHLERLMPLDPRHTQALVDEFRDVGRRAFVGTVASAIVQGTLAGVGFAMLGVPEPVTWGAILAVLSFIPVVGTLLVWVPATLWLVTMGHPARAALLVAWSLLLVMAATDYIIKPRLVGQGDDGAHPLLTLVALLGGISVFGVAGVIVGPVIMSLFVASARIYERERDDGVPRDERKM
jgi:predicted PurR-regulated permease PerM